MQAVAETSAAGTSAIAGGSQVGPTTRTLHPSAYLSPTEIAKLREEQGSAASSSSSRDVRRRLQACGFIQSLASLIGFPQRTAATAQLLYIRFHLFWPPAEFAVHEVATACLALSAKLHDTNKKSREILIASYSLRYPDLAKAPQQRLRAQQRAAGDAGDGRSVGGTTGAGQPFALATVAETDVDANVIETERKRILSLERLLLECIGFEFDLALKSQEALRLAIKIGRRWEVSSSVCQFAWSIAADSHRTHAPLQYPPSTIAVASLYLCALLIDSSLSNPPGATSPAESEELEHAQGTAAILSRMRSESATATGRDARWKEELRVHIEDVEESVHIIIDMYSAACELLPPTGGGTNSTSMTPISPATPASPAEPSSDSRLLGVGVGGGSSTDVGGSGTGNASRKIPPHAFSAPPLGVLAWMEHCRRAGSHGGGGGAAGGGEDVPSPSSMVAELTQIKIGLRQTEDARRAVDHQVLAQQMAAESGAGAIVPTRTTAGEKRSAGEVERLREAKRRRDLVTFASVVRALEKGGVVDGSEDLAHALPGSAPGLVSGTGAAAAARSGQKPVATRFLF